MCPPSIVDLASAAQPSSRYANHEDFFGRASGKMILERWRITRTQASYRLAPLKGFLLDSCPKKSAIVCTCYGDLACSNSVTMRTSKESKARLQAPHQKSGPGTQMQTWDCEDRHAHVTSIWRHCLRTAWQFWRPNFLSGRAKVICNCTKQAFCHAA